MKRKSGILIGTILTAVLFLAIHNAPKLVAQGQDIYARITNVETALWGGGLIGGGAPTFAIQGLGLTGRISYSTVPIGSVAYASFGTDTVQVAGTSLCGDLVIDRNMTITNINVLQGTIAGTDKLIGILYGPSGGVKLATSALAGVTVTTSNTVLVLPLTAPLAVTGPSKYWLCTQSNGTTDKIRTVAASTFPNILSKTSTGTFATIPLFVPPTTFTANVAPIAFVN